MPDTNQLPSMELPDRPAMIAEYRIDLSRLRSRCWWVVFGCAVTGALSALVGAIQLAKHYVVAVPIALEWQAWLIGEEFFLILSAAMLATSVMWLSWLHRAVANLKAVRARAMGFTPVAAVVWSLIPIVGLVMQFFIMRDVWQATMRRDDAVPSMVSLWAASAIAPAVAAFMPAILAGDFTSYDMYSEAIANVLQAVSVALQAVLAAQITRAQALMTDIADTFA